MENFQVIGCFRLPLLSHPIFLIFCGLAAGLGFGWAHFRVMCWAHFRVMCWALGTGDSERG